MPRLAAFDLEIFFEFCAQALRLGPAIEQSAGVVPVSASSSTPYRNFSLFSWNVFAAVFNPKVINMKWSQFRSLMDMSIFFNAPLRSISKDLLEVCLNSVPSRFFDVGEKEPRILQGQYRDTYKQTSSCGALSTSFSMTFKFSGVTADP